MARKLAANVDARIAELHRAHKTEATIASVLAREGVQITASGVHRVLGRLGLAKPRKAAKGNVVAAPALPPRSPSPPPSSPTVDGPEDDDAGARLRRAIDSLERCALAAEADKDVARVVAAQRAITQATGLLAKLTPPPIVDVDARPDMVAAAKRGRERMHALLERLLSEGGS